MYVIRNLTTKHTDLYPATGPTAENAAISIYDYITRYGLVEALSSDPGSDFTSKVVAKVNEYLGIKHMSSIVGVLSSQVSYNIHANVSFL